MRGGISINSSDKYDLIDWFEALPGRLVLDQESERFREILPTLFGYFAVQVGSFGPGDVLKQCCLIPSQIIIDSLGKPSIQATAQQLPVKSDSVDLVILPHVLEFEAQPHQILREVDRVLIPEGRLIITGFNPLSLWGVWRMLGRFRKRLPWRGHFLSLPRIKDWLTLLGFEVMRKEIFFHRPPLKRESMLGRLQFMEKFGAKWIPSFGAVYLIVAKKQELRLTPIKPRWVSRGRLVNSPPAVEGLDNG